MVVVIITIIIDSQIGYIADFIPEQLSSSAGVAAFIVIAIIFAVTQYFILLILSKVTKRLRQERLTLI